MYSASFSVTGDWLCGLRISMMLAEGRAGRPSLVEDAQVAGEQATQLHGHGEAGADHREQRRQAGAAVGDAVVQFRRLQGVAGPGPAKAGGVEHGQRDRPLVVGQKPSAAIQTKGSWRSNWPISVPGSRVTMDRSRSLRASRLSEVSQCTSTCTSG